MRSVWRLQYKRLFRVRGPGNRETVVHCGYQYTIGPRGDFRSLRPDPWGEGRARPAEGVRREPKVSKEVVMEQLYRNAQDSQTPYSRRAELQLDAEAQDRLYRNRLKITIHLPPFDKTDKATQRQLREANRATQKRNEQADNPPEHQDGTSRRYTALAGISDCIRDGQEEKMSTPALKAVIAHAIFNDGNGVPVLRLGVEAYKVTTPAGVVVAADGGNVEWAVSGVPAMVVTGGGNGSVEAHVG